MSEKVIKYTFPFFYTKKKKNVKIVLLYDDMLKVKLDNIILHNFANNTFQGGPSSKFSENGDYISHDDRDTTQEDQIVMLYRDKIHFPKKFYPICDDETISLLYHPEVDNLPPVITIPCLMKPNLKNKANRENIITRIKLIFQVCALYNKNLLTGLWGCGAFGISTTEMSDLWDEAISTCDYAPKIIYFSIHIDKYTKYNQDISGFKNLERKWK